MLRLLLLLLLAHAAACAAASLLEAQFRQVLLGHQVPAKQTAAGTAPHDWLAPVHVVVVDLYQTAACASNQLQRQRTSPFGTPDTAWLGSCILLHSCHVL